MARKNPPFDPRPLALESLGKSLGDPTPKVLLGSAKLPGFFAGSAEKTRKAANYCVEQGWLQDTGEKVKSGSTQKSLYRLTATGINAVMDHTPAIQALADLALTLSRHKQQLQSTLQFFQQYESILSQMTQVVEQSSKKLELLEVPKHGPLATDSQNDSNPEWDDEVISLARESNPNEPISLPDLYSRLKKHSPSLTYGAFLDRLLQLWDQKRIHLMPFTRAYASIAGDRAAMFLDGEVMYYVRGVD